MGRGRLDVHGLDRCRVVWREMDRCILGWGEMVCWGLGWCPLERRTLDLWSVGRGSLVWWPLVGRVVDLAD